MSTASRAVPTERPAAVGKIADAGVSHRTDTAGDFAHPTQAAAYPRRSSGAARISAQNTLYLDFGA
jgi:hypothetical protein